MLGDGWQTTFPPTVPVCCTGTAKSCKKMVVSIKCFCTDFPKKENALLFFLIVPVWVERLVVVAVDLKSGTEQLLGILKLADGTGKSQAEAVLSLAREWDLAHRVVGLSFDTTASNTSPSKGACVLIELGLGRKLLRLACRHHVLELPVKGGFEALIGPSQSPDIPLFTRFKNFWPQIDKGNYSEKWHSHEFFISFNN
jgi:hypothetical protein